VSRRNCERKNKPLERKKSEEGSGAPNKALVESKSLVLRAFS
jgi:hypothetical protein